MSQTIQVMDMIRKFSATGLQRTLLTISDIVQGKGTRTDVLFLDAAILGSFGLLSIITPGLVTGFVGAGFSSSTYAASCTRTMGIYMIIVTYLINGTKQTTVEVQVAKALMLFWVLSTINVFHMIAYTELSSICHYISFLVCTAMTLAHAIAGKIIAF